MDISLVKAFVVLAKHMNYRVAAEQLFITQSALTKKIQRLEKQLDIQLFERNQRGVTITPIGKTVLTSATSLINSHQQFMRNVEGAASGSRGSLHIGFGVSCLTIAPKLIAKFKQAYPSVQIKLEDLPSQTQLALLSSNELDLAFNRQPSSGDYSFLPLKTDQLALVLHPSVDSENVDQKLNTLPYLSLPADRGLGLHKQIRAYCHDVQWDLEPTQTADDILTLVSLVAANLGFTIVPMSAKALSHDKLQFIPLEGEYAKWPVGVVWKQDSANPITQRFVEMLTHSLAL